MERSRVVEAAYSWVGTPYCHRQRVKGPQGGADCIQFLIGMGIDLGIYPGDPTAPIPWYSTQWHLHQNQELLMAGIEELGLIEIENRHVKPGDILGFKYGKAMAHLAILVKKDIIVHALMAYPSRVLEQRLDVALKRRIHKCYKIPGVDD